MQESITRTEYRAFQKAYDFFNHELFDNSLPHVLATLQRKSGARGYFSADRFSGRVEDIAAHEVAMNPDKFTGRTDEEILSTLAHEMVHVWENAFGNPTHGYHGKKFAAKMREIGLYPSSTGEPGGKETGQKVSHYILHDGRYAKAYAKLSKGGFHLNWQSAPASKNARAKVESKTKFTCPGCGQNSWGKPSAKLNCGKCATRNQAQS